MAVFAGRRSSLFFVWISSVVSMGWLYCHKRGVCEVVGLRGGVKALVSWRSRKELVGYECFCRRRNDAHRKIVIAWIVYAMVFPGFYLM